MPASAEFFVPQRDIGALYRELRCSLLAQQTIQPAANHGRAALWSLHPGPHLPWRLVAHMQRVPTLKLGYPLTFGVPPCECA